MISRLLRCLIVTAGVLAVVHSTSLAQGGGGLFPNLGGQRAGISGLTLLKNDLNPRSVGMGGANVTLSGDGYSIANNPAAVSEVRTLTISSTNLYYAGGINHALFTVALPITENGTFVFSMNNLNSGWMERRTEFQPGGTGEYFSANHFVTGVGYSVRLSEMFSFGINAKYIQENLAEYTARAAGVDMGFLYRTDYKDLRFGATLYNFGNNSTLSGDGRPVVFNRPGEIGLDAYPLPTEFKMGASIRPFDDGTNSLMVAAQLNHPNDNAENIRLGVEYKWNDLFAARLGYKINVENETFPTFGVGTRAMFGRHPLYIDYAVSPSNSLGIWHSIGISLGINSATRDAVVPTYE